MAAEIEEVEVAVRGANYTIAEDMCMAKAFISASEDATVGTNQKSADFQAKFYLVYVALLTDHNKTFGASLPFRNAKKIWHRFKKLSKLVLKLIGTVESVGDPPSGDNDREEYDRLLKEEFGRRVPEGKNMFENIVAAKEFLQDKPKWRQYQEDDGKSKKKNRPEGTKKSKEKARERELVESVITANSNSMEEKLKEHLQKKEAFMASVQHLTDVMTRSMERSTRNAEESNRLKLIEMMSPKSRSVAASEHYQESKRQRLDNAIMVEEPLEQFLANFQSGSNPEGDNDSCSSGGDNRPGTSQFRGL